MLKRHVILLLSMLLLVACTGHINDSEDKSGENVTQNEGITLDGLNNTNHFRDGALGHIFIGEINHSGDAVGFHFDGFPGKKGSIISGTKTKPDELGVYEAGVEVNDVKKTSNSGKSSFFPADWTAQEVVAAINEAYENRMRLTGNTYEGLTEAGMVVHMYLDDSDHIISAFPVYDE